MRQSPHEKANSKGKKSRKTNCTLFADKKFGIRYAMKRKISERREAEKCPKRFSGHLRSPSLSVLRPSESESACACRDGAKRRRSRIKDKHTHGLQPVNL